jgi:hypothetical protein
MLDVLHYLFEKDLRYSTAEEADVVENTRVQIYGSMYNRTYRYRSNKSRARPPSFGGASNFDDFPTTTNERKPYIPPSDFNPDSALPFGSNLDAPLK